MKKLKIIIALMLTLCVNDYLFSNVIYVADPGADNDIYPNALTAYNSCINGDYIAFPAGNFTFSGRLTLTKNVSIKGLGKNITVLYRSESMSDATLESVESFFFYNINSTTSSGIVVKDLTLRSKNPCLVSTFDGNQNDLVATDGLSLARDKGIDFNGVVDFVVTNCKLQNFGNAAIYVKHHDSIVSGLIYNNEFLHNSKGTYARGLGYGVVVYGSNYVWLKNPRFGTKNFIFVENNTFDFHKHSIAAGGCALYVFRYNYVKDNIAGSSTAAVDGHEGRYGASGSSLGDGNYFASRGIECYGNKLKNFTFRNQNAGIANGTLISSIGTLTEYHVDQLTESAIKARGGEWIVNNDTIDGYRMGVAISVNASCGSSCGTYPINGQSGYLSGKALGANHTGYANNGGDGDFFTWNNKYTKLYPSSSGSNAFYNYNSDTVYVRHNRDYHLEVKPGYTPYTYPHPNRLPVITSFDEGFTVAGTIVLSTNNAVSSLYCVYVPNYKFRAKTTKVYVDLMFYTSKTDYEAGAARVYPKYQSKKIGQVPIVIRATDQIKASGQSLASDYFNYEKSLIKSAVSLTFGYSAM